MENDIFFLLNEDCKSEYFFFAPFFEASSATLPTLRSILVFQNISYKPRATKVELVELFQTNLWPKRVQILTEIKKLGESPSTEGITDI